MTDIVCCQNFSADGVRICNHHTKFISKLLELALVLQLFDEPPYLMCFPFQGAGHRVDWLHNPCPMGVPHA